MHRRENRPLAFHGVNKKRSRGKRSTGGSQGAVLVAFLLVLVFVVRNGGHLWKSEEVGNVPTPDDPTPTFNPADLPPKKELKVTPIPRIPAGSLSVKEFYEQWGDRFVIVEGEVSGHAAMRLGLRGLREICGEGQVITRMYQKRSPLWGGISESVELTLGDYVDKYLLNTSSDYSEENPRYASGSIGISMLCPALEPFIPTSQYVSAGLFPTEPNPQVSDNGKLILRDQPEVFLGGKNSKTEIHVDMVPSPFWMAVYFGHKRFRTIHYDEAKVHLPYFRKKDGPIRLKRKGLDRETGKVVSKHLEIFDPDLETFPELEKVTVWEGDIKAGDWLYIPTAAMHGAQNQEDTLGVSTNSVPPPVIQRYMNVCADTEAFLEGCKHVFTVPFDEIGYDNDKAGMDEMLRVLTESQFVRSFMKEYDEGKSREKFVHEMSGFGSVDVWCRYFCEEFTREEKRGKMKSQKVEYVCGQCARLSDFDPSKWS